MARTTTEHVIGIQSASKHGFLRREALADEAFYPGHVLRFDSDEELEKHATSGGVLVGKLVADINPTPDTVTYPTTAAVSIPYAADDTAYYIECQPGDIVQAMLAASQTVVKGVTQLVSQGGTVAGTLAAETVDQTTLTGAVFGVADEDATTTASATATLVRVRVT